MSTTISNKEWRHICGVVYRLTLRQRQPIADILVSRPESEAVDYVQWVHKLTREEAREYVSAYIVYAEGIEEIYRNPKTGALYRPQEPYRFDA